MIKIYCKEYDLPHIDSCLQYHDSDETTFCDSVENALDCNNCQYSLDNIKVIFHDLNRIIIESDIPLEDLHIDHCLSNISSNPKYCGMDIKCQDCKFYYRNIEYIYRKE